MAGIHIKVTDLDNPNVSGEREIMDDYMLITAGTAEVSSLQVFDKADGTQTYQITIKGIRRRGPHPEKEPENG